ncbi:MAG: antibiotic resistance protein VanZ [Chloroflexi bacterium]|nr:MAG: antibiotic resistance protein VanZ [Chloroflexota bacterium]
MNNQNWRNWRARLIAWGPALLWMGGIFYLSSRSTLPGPSNPFWDTLLKKGGHATVYALLAVLYRRALRPALQPNTRLHGTAWLLAALYAITDEAHQHFVPGRHATLTDWLIDGAGAALGLFLAARRTRESAPAVPTAQSESPQKVHPASPVPPAV